jgi:hypothetical protein
LASSATPEHGGRRCARLPLTSGGTTTLHVNEQLVETGDLDALTERIDSLCFDNAWPSITDLRDRCRAALSRGKQLWPAAAYAEYRMALDAPAEVASSVLGSAADRFALGPFAEVIATNHSFESLEPYLDRGPNGCALAHERVVRGQDLCAYEWLHAGNDPFGLPFVRASWEPTYGAPVYEPNKLRADTPDLPKFSAVEEAAPGARRLTTEKPTESALRDLTANWVSQSNGRSEVVTVEGTAADAIAALGCRSHRLAAIDAAAAMDWMAWAAASGGAHGRRRGLAAGRHGALWALLNLAGIAEPDLVVTSDVLLEVGDILPELRFHLWDDGAPATGWTLRLAVEDTTEGLAWALNAHDARLD